jgi:hypothetical protein
MQQHHHVYKEHIVWADIIAITSPEPLCDPFNVVITIKKSIHVLPSIESYFVDRTIYMDLLPTFAHQGITPSTTLQCYHIMVDKTSREPHLIGFNDYTSYSVFTTVNELTAPYNHPVTVEHINIRNIKTDAGTHFTSRNLREACANINIELFIAAPTRQY